MKIRILEGRYQRNGIAGRGFYQIRFDVLGREGGEGYIATFETITEDPQANGHDDVNIDVSSTRVIDPNHFSESWHGDEFAKAIQEEIDRQKAVHGVSKVFDVIYQTWRETSMNNQVKRKRTEEKIL